MSSDGSRWSIRQARPDDLEAMSCLEREGFSQPWSRESLLAQVQDPRHCQVQVALSENGAVIGYGAYRRILDEAEITRLAVCPKRRRQKIGGALLRSLLCSARSEGVCRMHLEVRQSNLAARKLYEDAGFLVCGHRPRYYQDEDAIIMQKTLPPECSGLVQKVDG